MRLKKMFGVIPGLLTEFLGRTSVPAMFTVLALLTAAISFNTYQIDTVSRSVKSQADAQVLNSKSIAGLKADVAGLKDSVREMNDAFNILMQAMLNQKGEVCLKGSSISGRDNIICVKPQRIASDDDESLRAGG